MIKDLNSKTIQGFIGYCLIGSVKPHANTPLRAVQSRDMVSLCLLGFIIKRSANFAIFHFSHSSWHQLRLVGRIHFGRI
jgi:hypothetical protein